ncbi:MAG TPA: 3-phosphoshikimate 1-carboxyvinyltransferase [Longimicrobiales bacterium]|nr:3-phosphoshikimate 1-carboxyvinyltransferase [Longimicrobiales bacterium]
MTGIRVPGDKSLTHRALMLAALADGESIIRAPLAGADTRSTAAALRSLGCAVPAIDTAVITQRGVGLHGLRAPAQEIDCGNSGTTTRLLLGILAGCDFGATLTGDASLRSRPMRRVTEPLARMGARFEELGAADRLPIRIHGGALQPLDHASPHASAQVKSALLLAGLTGGVPVSVREPIMSRDHTERMLQRLGVPLRQTASEQAYEVALTPVGSIPGFEFDVPGDFSSAAFVIALATLYAREPVRITGVGLNPTRTGFLSVLLRMGGDVAIENARETCGEPIGDIVVTRSPLRATDIEPHEVPALIDEIPVLAILAARAAGTTTVTGAHELRIKESDRIAAIAANLKAIGVVAEELPDGLVIHGTDAPLRGQVHALHDHRIAMAFGLLAHRNDIGIDDRGSADVSYPGFWDMLAAVTS